MSRIIAIGDIHGHYTKLLDLMEQIQPTKGDKFIFLGDYVDTGPQVPEVIEYLIDFRRYRDATFLLGNHDAWFLDWVQGGGADDAWLLYGGMRTIGQYGSLNRPSDVPREHVEFLRQASAPVRFPTMLDREYWFSHGMLCPTKPLESRRDEWDALCGRPSSFGWHDLNGKMERANKKPIAWNPNQYLVFAHTPHEEPTEYDGIALCIDTGAKKDERPLTAVILSEVPGKPHRFIQSSALTVDIEIVRFNEEENADS